MNTSRIVEAVLFASDAPLTADEIARADGQLDEDQVEDALQTLQAEYDDAQRAFQLVEIAGGYQVLTRPEFAPYLERFDNVKVWEVSIAGALHRVRDRVADPAGISTPLPTLQATSHGARVRLVFAIIRAFLWVVAKWR